MSQIAVPVSYGELIDKITILEIKAERIGDPAKLANVRTELDLLIRTWGEAAQSATDISVERARLKAVNEGLWEIEDRIRVKEKAKAFDAEFIELARSVYVRNDERAAAKREVNQKLGSTLVEENPTRTTSEMRGRACTTLRRAEIRWLQRAVDCRLVASGYRSCRNPQQRVQTVRKPPRIESGQDWNGIWRNSVCVMARQCSCASSSTRTRWRCGSRGRRASCPL